MRSNMKLLAAAVLVLAFDRLAVAQGQSPLLIRVQQGQTGSQIVEGGTVVLASETPRGAATATLTITNRGTSTLTFVRPSVTGSTDFRYGGLPEDTVLNVPANGSLTITVRYTPTSSARTQSTVSFAYGEGGRTTGQFQINFVGTSPEYAFSFTPRDGNATPVAAGGTITFPLTPVDATSTSLVVITNRGTAPVVFNSAAVTGTAFAPAGLPLPGTLIEPGRDLRFNVSFTPKQLAPASGGLSVDIAGQRTDFVLSGTASTPVFTIEVIEPRPAPVAAGGQVLLPDTSVGERSSVVVRLRNTGNAEGRLTAIAVQGQAFTITDAPFLPITLQTNATATFRINFNPTEPGRLTGRLRVNEDNYDLVGNGLGIALTYSYAAGGTSTSVANRGDLVFTPTSVGRSSDLQFQIANTGTLQATINSIGVAGANVYTLVDAPPLPAQLEPGANLAVRVRFSPTALGATTATLRVDNSTFSLIGSGTNPAPLPDYRIDGPTGPQAPRQQPAVSLTLNSGYTLPVSGTLTLTFTSEVFADDPAVQFASGGRTVAFTIPANTTRAVFPDGSNQIRLQTGTVAGTITLAPSFAVTEGGVSLTPQNAPTLRLAVAQSAPQILNAIVSAKTGAGFTLQITGFATSRSVTRMNINFNGRSGEKIETTSLALNVESSFLAWYQGAASLPFGSLFNVTVPLTMTGDVIGSNLSLADTIQSVSVTLSNALGTSNAVTAEIR